MRRGPSLALPLTLIAAFVLLLVACGGDAAAPSDVAAGPPAAEVEASLDRLAVSVRRLEVAVGELQAERERGRAALDEVLARVRELDREMRRLRGGELDLADRLIFTNGDYGPCALPGADCD